MHLTANTALTVTFFYERDDNGSASITITIRESTPTKLTTIGIILPGITFQLIYGFWILSVTTQTVRLFQYCTFFSLQNSKNICIVKSSTKYKYYLMLILVFIQ